ncbi:Acyltransferase [Aphelenchoides besseyi]|nr:Acyltransferase [Aphelenchoides besseyi]
MLANSILKSLNELTAAAFHIFLWIILPLISLWLPLYILCFTRFWPFMILYAIWFLYDLRTPTRGSRNWHWFKSLPLWKHFANYFPIRLVKTAELPADRNYILGCHPHGVLSISAFTHLCTYGTNFCDHFPGLEPNILTLNGQFWFPFRREIGISLGGVESSATSLDYLLRSKTVGRIVGIVIGGAEEALVFESGRIIYRKYFMTHTRANTSASLVPSYSFGENDVFHQAGNDRGTKLRAVQRKIKKLIGFCPPCFYGTGLFTTRFGLLPRRRPITTVFGAPITVEKCLNPTAEQVDELHRTYVNALIVLFNTYKKEYDPDAEIHIV